MCFLQPLSVSHTTKQKKLLCVRARLSLGREKKVYQSSDTCFGNSPFVPLSYQNNLDFFLLSFLILKIRGLERKKHPEIPYNSETHNTAAGDPITELPSSPTFSTTTTTEGGRESSQDNRGKRRSRILNFPSPYRHRYAHG